MLSSTTSISSLPMTTLSPYYVASILLLYCSPAMNGFIIKSCAITAPVFFWTLQYVSFLITSSLLGFSSFETVLTWLDHVRSCRPCKRVQIFIRNAIVSHRKSVKLSIKFIFLRYHSSLFLDSDLEGAKAGSVRPITWLLGWIR